MKPIVVVEDEEAVLGLIVRLLGDAGYPAQGASSVEAAAQLATELEPALVICDHVLEKDAAGRPTRTHREVLGLWPGAPVLVVSGYEPDDPRYVEVEPDVYHGPPPLPTCWLRKPILKERIATAVRVLIGPPTPEGV